MFLRVLHQRVAQMCTLLGLLMLAGGQLQAQNGALTGRITDAATGNGLPAVQVRIVGVNMGIVTGDDGTYRIVNVPAGVYTVTVKRVGYQERSVPDVAITAGGTATFNLALQEATTILNAVAVTQTRNLPEKLLDAPAQISVITSERIAERPALTATDHLRTTAGVDINKGGLVQANIVTRGFNNAFSGSMLMLQDYRFAGVPSLRVNVPFLFTGTNEDIDRIEVLLGPASALYGPNSANGVLHIITKSPFNSEGTTLSVDGGERDVLRLGARHSQVFTNKIAMKLSGEYMQGNDWEFQDQSEPALFPAVAPPGRRGQPNQRDFALSRYTGEARLDIRPRDDVELITTFGYTKVGSGLELTGANGTSQIKNWTYSNLQQRFRWGRFFAQAFINSSNAGNEDSLSTTGTFLLQSGQPIVDKSSVMVAQAQHGVDLLDGKQVFTYGFDFIATNPETGGTINGRNEDDDNVREWGGYLQSTTKLNQYVDLIGSARIDGNNVVEGQFFSPRAAVLFKPNDRQTFRLAYNRAFQTPANFAFFLDLVRSRAAGLNPYDVKVQGNPPKQGFQFRRDCTGGALGGLCMRSPFTGGAFEGVNAGSALQGLFVGAGPQLGGALQAIITGALVQAGQSQANAAAIAAQLAPGLVQSAASNTPTAQQIPSLVLLGSTLIPTADALSDIAPLKASFNNTYEVGYKALLADRVNLDVSVWTQQRGDVGLSAAQATPIVATAPQAMQAYLSGLWSPIFAGAGLPTALRDGVIAALVNGAQGQPGISALPLGVVTWDDDPQAARSIYATYQSASTKSIWLRGLDIASEILISPRFSVNGTYSYSDPTVFDDVPGGNDTPLMINAPGSRGSLGMRFDDGERGITSEFRLRYNESYPVNSAVYATNVQFPIGAGNPGALSSPPSTVVAGCEGTITPGRFCFEGVPEAFQVDLGFSKTFTFSGSQRVLWSLNATNVFDNKVRTFPGVPEIGRLVMTRLQYSF